MKTITRTAVYNASPENVFNFLDDLGTTGIHMTKSSPMMMGSKLHLEYLTQDLYWPWFKIPVDWKHDGNENGFYSGSNQMDRGC